MTKSKNRLLFVNPDSQKDTTITYKTNFRLRENLTAKLSYDEGDTWEVQKMLDSGKAGYSDLAVGRDGMLYCLYETNTDSSEKWKYKIVLKRFNLQWLTDGQDISNSLIR